MTAIEIRRLGAGDNARLRAMLSMFGKAFDDPATYSGAPPSDAYLQKLLRSDSFIAIVARKGAHVIGGLAAYVLHKFEQERAEIYIYDLAVDEGHRRLGVATGLIEALEIEARASGAYVIFVQADHSDPPAIALYSKLGVREDVLHFDIEP